MSYLESGELGVRQTKEDVVRPKTSTQMSTGKEEGRLEPCRITALSDEKAGEAGRERGAYQRVILKRWVLFLNP